MYVLTSTIGFFYLLRYWPGYVSNPHIPELRPPDADELFVVYYQGKDGDNYAYVCKVAISTLGPTRL